MQLKKALLKLSLIVLTFFPTIQFVCANPLFPPISLFEVTIQYLLLCLFGFFIVIVIECSIGSLFTINKRLEPKFLLKNILIINAITYPLAQLIGIIFYFYYLPIFIVEIFVIIAEWILVFNIFTKHRTVEVEHKFNLRILLFIFSLMANFLSFLVGVLIFINPYAHFWGLFSF